MITEKVMLHNFMVAADSAVVLFELDVHGIRLEPTNKRLNSTYLQIKYIFSKKKFTLIHFD